MGGRPRGCRQRIRATKKRQIELQGNIDVRQVNSGVQSRIGRHEKPWPSDEGDSGEPPGKVGAHARQAVLQHDFAVARALRDKTLAASLETRKRGRARRESPEARAPQTADRRGRLPRRAQKRKITKSRQTPGRQGGPSLGQEFTLRVGDRIRPKHRPKPREKSQAGSSKIGPRARRHRPWPARWLPSRCDDRPSAERRLGQTPIFVAPQRTRDLRGPARGTAQFVGRPAKTVFTLKARPRGVVAGTYVKRKNGDWASLQPDLEHRVDGKPTPRPDRGP